MNQIGALTVLRGIAAWWVVFYHFADYYPQLGVAWLQKVSAPGFLAVDLFFILSGFVISLNYAHYFEQRLAWTSVRDFLLRRIARIYPLHFALSILYLANPVAILLLSSDKNLYDRYQLGYYALSLFLVHNWGFTNTLDWNVPSWSISAEMLAYLFFPFAIWGAKQTLRTTWHYGMALVALAVALALIFRMTGAHSIGESIPQLGAIRCVIEFCMGGCVYRLIRATPAQHGSRFSGTAIIAGVGLTAAVVAGALADYEAMPFAFAAFVYALGIESAIASRFLNALPLHFIGLVSYSTYLVHYFIKDWVKFLLIKDTTASALPLVVYIAAVAAASCVLYYTVEVPGRKFLQELSARFTKRAAP